MRRMCFCIVIMSICLGILTSCSGEKTINAENKEYKVEISNFAFGIAAGENNHIYVSDKDLIHIINSGESGETYKRYEGLFLTAICTEGEYLYAIDIVKRQLIEINSEGEMVKATPLEMAENIAPDSIYKIRKYGDVLVAMERESDEHGHTGQSNQLAIYELISGKRTALDFDHVIDFSFMDQDTICIASGQNIPTKLSIFNLQTMSRDQIYEYNYRIQSMEYDEKRKTLYYTVGMEVFETSLDVLEPKFIGKYKHDLKAEAYQNICLSTDSIYLLDAASGIVAKLPMDGKELTNELTVLTPIEGLPIPNAFSEKYPEVHVNYLQIPSVEYGQKLKTKLLSGDDTFDMFYVQDGFEEYCSNGLFVDLRQYSELNGKIEKLLPQFKLACQYKENVFGIPISTPIFDVLFYRNDSNDINEKVQSGDITWNDLINIAIMGASGNANALHADNRIVEFGTETAVRRMLFNQYLANYCNIEREELQFDTPAFRDVLIKLKTMKKNGLFTDKPSRIDQLLDNKRLAVAPYFIKNHIMPKKDIKYTMAPCIDGNNANILHMEISWYIINPLSRNKDIAADFMLGFMDQIPDVYIEGSVLPEDESEEGEFIRSVVDRSRVVGIDNITFEMDDIMNQYYTDIITVDVAAKMISDKIRMAFAK